MTVEDVNPHNKTGTRVTICLPMIFENTIFGTNEKSSNN